MNTRKIKLGLTIDLLNNTQCSTCINVVKEKMAKFGKEVGNLIQATIIRISEVNSEIENRTYALQYENCTLNVDLAYNKTNHNQYINGFQLI